MTLDVMGIFIAGLLTFLTPCVLPLIPIYLAALAGWRSWQLERCGSGTAFVPFPAVFGGISAGIHFDGTDRLDSRWFSGRPQGRDSTGDGGFDSAVRAEIHRFHSNSPVSIGLYEPTILASTPVSVLLMPSSWESCSPPGGRPASVRCWDRSSPSPPRPPAIH